MVKKHRLIKGICDKLRGITAINFQMKIKEVLKIYYKQKIRHLKCQDPKVEIRRMMVM